MTDARFPERYLSDRRVLRLDAEEFRAWTLATLWSVSNRTDGQIDVRDVDLIPALDVGIAEVLVDAGLWANTSSGWSIVDFAQTQTSRHELEVLENARRRDREKKARQRGAKGAEAPAFSDVPGDSPGGSSPGTSRGRVPGEGTGQAGRTGRDQDTWFVNDETGEVTDSVPAAVTSWSVAPIGQQVCRVPGCSVDVAGISTGVCPSQDDAHNEYRLQPHRAA